MHIHRTVTVTTMSRSLHAGFTIKRYFIRKEINVKAVLSVETGVLPLPTITISSKSRLKVHFDKSKIVEQVAITEKNQSATQIACRQQLGQIHTEQL